MRTRVPLRCVQATAAADTARFRLWTDPAESDYEGSIDFKGRAADFHGTRRTSGRVLRTVSFPDATYLREPGRPGWMRLHSSRWRQGSWDPFGVLDDARPDAHGIGPKGPPADRTHGTSSCPSASWYSSSSESLLTCVGSTVGSVSSPSRASCAACFICSARASTKLIVL